MPGAERSPPNPSLVNLRLRLAKALTHRKRFRYSGRRIRLDNHQFHPLLVVMRRNLLLISSESQQEPLRFPLVLLLLAPQQAHLEQPSVLGANQLTQYSVKQPLVNKVVRRPSVPQARLAANRSLLLSRLGLRLVLHPRLEGVR